MDGSLHPAPLASDRPRVFMVSAENLLRVWPGVAELLGPLVAKRPTHTIDDVRDMLLARQCQLWVQWSSLLEGAFITEIATYPRGTWARIWLGAVRPDRRLSDDVFKLIDVWRQANGWRGLEVIGRRGWQRRFPQAVDEGAVFRLTDA